MTETFRIAILLKVSCATGSAELLVLGRGIVSLAQADHLTALVLLPRQPEGVVADRLMLLLV